MDGLRIPSQSHALKYIMLSQKEKGGDDGGRDKQGREELCNCLVEQLGFDPHGPQRCRFDDNASYFVPGGLGGLGRSIPNRMTSCRAKHLKVPSRSDASSAEAAKTVALLSSKGVDIATSKCDATTEAELAALVEDSRKSTSPIHGVINCAMVLPNAVFANMDFHQLDSCREHEGSCLVQPTPNQLDFLIHFFSLASTNSQMMGSNYAGGCNSQGTPAQRYPGVTTFNVG